MSKVTKTTEIVNITITNIVEGDTSAATMDEELKKSFAEGLKAYLGADDVVIEYAKAFVMEEETDTIPGSEEVEDTVEPACATQGEEDKNEEEVSD